MPTVPPCAADCWFVQSLLADRAHLLADRARLTGTTLASSPDCRPDPLPSVRMTSTRRDRSPRDR